MADHRLFTLDQVSALRDIEKARVRNGQPGLRDAFQEFINSMKSGQSSAPGEGQQSLIVPEPRIVAFQRTIEYGLGLNGLCHKHGVTIENAHIGEEHFPLSGSGTVDVEILVAIFGYRISNEAVTQVFNRLGMEDGGIDHVIVLADAECIAPYFPLVTRRFLGVHPHRSCHIPYLYDDCLGRYLDLEYLGVVYWGGEWTDYCSFVTVRKNKVKVLGHSAA